MQHISQAYLIEGYIDVNSDLVQKINATCAHVKITTIYYYKTCYAAAKLIYLKRNNIS